MRFKSVPNSFIGESFHITPRSRGRSPIYPVHIAPSTFLRKQYRATLKAWLSNFAVAPGFIDILDFPPPPKLPAFLFALCGARELQITSTLQLLKEARVGYIGP